MEELLNNIGIRKKGHFGDSGEYIIDIDNSNEWGVIYSKLDKSPDLELQDDSSILTEEDSSIIYFSDDYQFTLMADFDNNLYKLVVSEF